MADTTEHPYAPLVAGFIEPKIRMREIERVLEQLATQGVGHLSAEDRAQSLAKCARQRDALIAEYVELRQRT